MALDAFMAYVGVYSSVDAAKADYDAVHDLHTSLDAGETGLVVVGVSDMSAKTQGAMAKADTEEIQKDAGVES